MHTLDPIGHLIDPLEHLRHTLDLFPGRRASRRGQEGATGAEVRISKADQEAGCDPRRAVGGGLDCRKQQGLQHLRGVDAFKRWMCVCV